MHDGLFLLVVVRLRGRVFRRNWLILRKPTQSIFEDNASTWRCSQSPR